MSRARALLPLLVALLGTGCDGTAEPGTAAPPPVPARDAATLAALLGHDLGAARRAVEEVMERGDRRYVPVMMELMRASQLGLLHADGRSAYHQALEALTGETLGGDWRAWMDWYADSEIEPPPGFAGFKGQILARVEPKFGEILRDGVPSRIRLEEVVWGGVAYEGIPALDRPKTVAAAQADYLEPAEPVFGLVLGAEARAYPQRILDWHELTNDVVGGVPVSLTYCTLCGAAIAWEGRARDGATYDFGSSGLLMRSNKLMVDRQTRTLWNQFTGRPVLGPLARDETLKLRMVPVVVARWKDWREAHPDTRVLSLDTGHQRPYTPGAAYGDYFAASGLMFPAPASRRLPVKERVYGLEVAGLAKAWPLAALVEERVVNDELGFETLVLVATRGRIQVEGEDLRSGPARFDAGGEVRAYARGDRRFAPTADAGILVDQDGRRWRPGAEALEGPDGETLERLPGHLAYWFGWHAFHPRTLLYGEAP